MGKWMYGETAWSIFYCTTQEESNKAHAQRVNAGEKF